MHFKLGQEIIDKIRQKKPTIELNLAQQEPKGTDRIKAEDLLISRHYTYDYENISETIVKDRKVLYIDIGANEGQSAKLAYKYFQNVNVISYEPLNSCIEKLEDVKKNHPNHIYKNVAMSNNKSHYYE